MTPFKRGDIVMVLFPHSSLQTFQRRPALVIQADHLGTGLSQIVLALVTSNLARLGHSSRVFVSLVSPAGAASGLMTDSVIMTDNLATVLDRAIDSRLGTLPDMSAVDVALRHTLGL